MENASLSFNLYAKTSSCEQKVGDSLGTVAVSYEDGEVLVTYNIDKAYDLMERNTYAGKSILPLNADGTTTLLPDQYEISNNLRGEIYIITHAVICPKQLNPIFTD